MNRADKCGRCNTGKSRRRRVSKGVTLLELLLALALSTIVLYMLSLLISMNVSKVERRQAEMTESQLADVILNQIAKDLRNAVYYWDDDPRSNFLSQGLTGGSDDLTDQPSPANASSSSDSSSSNGANDSRQAGDSATSQDSQGNAAGDSKEGEEKEGDDQDATLSGSNVLASVSGIYGTSTDLQIDASRLPRTDQYQARVRTTPNELLDQPSSVKTVAYFMRSTDLVDAVGQNQPAGLYRRQLDQSVTNWANEKGNVTGLDSTAELLASEVASLTFRYFDGEMWWEYWDSQSFQGLPMIVEISLTMNRPDARQDDSNSTASEATPSIGSPTTNAPTSAAATTATTNLAADSDAQTGSATYRLLVELPTALSPSDSFSSSSSTTSDSTTDSPNSDSNDQSSRGL